MENEYLQRYLEAAGGRPFRRWGQLIESSHEDIVLQVEREARAIGERHRLVTEYAWAIPDERALKLLSELAPLVEVGAGGGYWAAQLRARGVDIVAYDARPGGPSPTERNGRPIRMWTSVLAGDARAAAQHPERTLFLCWPPYDSPMALEALSAYLDAGGRTLAYVGEDWGGCNATDEFFERLGEWMTEHETVAIPQWPGIHDYLTVYRAGGAA